MAGADARVVLFPGEIKKFLTGAEVIRDVTVRSLRVVGAAKRLCPVDSGRLRSSIRFYITRDEIGILGVVGTDVEYAVFVHDGTRFMPARPFLRDALPAAA